MTAGRPTIKEAGGQEDVMAFMVQPGGDPDTRTLSLENSPTVLLVFAANRFTRIWSRYLQARFGLGAMDWRMMVMLTAEPNIPVTRASQVINIDKGAVSRALARLEAKRLAEASVPESYRQRRTWRLTNAGAGLHDEILQVALERQQKILAGLSVDDVVRLNQSLRLILDNLANLDTRPD